MAFSMSLALHADADTPLKVYDDTSGTAGPVVRVRIGDAPDPPNLYLWDQETLDRLHAELGRVIREREESKSATVHELQATEPTP